MPAAQPSPTVSRVRTWNGLEKKLCRLVQSQQAEVFQYPVSLSTVTFLTKMMEDCDTLSNLKDDHPEKIKEAVVLFAELEEALPPLFEAVRNDAGLPASPAWMNKELRTRLASLLFVSGKAEIEDRTEFDLLALGIADGLSHIGLGLSLLDGDPLKIREAYGMDTAPREMLPDEVKAWLYHDFASHGPDRVFLKAQEELGILEEKLPASRKKAKGPGRL